MDMTTPSPDELKSLREAAEKAPREFGPMTIQLEPQVSYMREAWCMRGPLRYQTPRDDEHFDMARRDLIFYSSASPEMVLRLLDMISTLETRVAQQSGALDVMRDALEEARTKTPGPTGRLLLNSKQWTAAKASEAIAKADKILRGGEGER